MEPQLPTPQDATTPNNPNISGTASREEVNAILKPLRTYERDIADMIRANQVSASSVNLAEKRRDEVRVEAEARAKSQAENGGVDFSKPITTPLSVAIPTSNLIRTKVEVSTPIFIPSEMSSLAKKESELFASTQNTTPTYETYEPTITPAEPVAQVAQVAPKETSFYVLHSNPIVPPAIAPRKEYFLPQKEHHSHSALFTALSIVLIFIGIGVLVWLYFLKAESPVIKTQPVVISTFLPSNQENNFDMRGLSILQTVNKMSAFLNNNYPKDSITQIKIVTNTATTTSVTAVTTEETSANTFFESFASRIPTSLTRAFSKKMFAGIYTLDKNHAFFIIQIDSFDRAFEGMLAWEKNMYADLKLFINKTDVVITENAESGGGLITAPLKSFEDVIVQNKDTRVLKNNQGDTLMMYSFIDQKTLFIVDNESTFKEILKRFEASKSLQ